jgi:hypothetical protein
VRRLFCATIAVLGACSNNSPPQPPAKPVATTPRSDAGVPGVTTIRGYDPASGMHLDEGGDRRPIVPPAAPRAPHPIDITLRSTPPGAQVAVDGAPVGYTPTYWPGEADGREHEFTFVLPAHATARYRFVPVASGVVHARLEPIVEEPDAGVRESAPEGAPLPGAGSALVNPPPAPVAPKDAPARPDAAEPPGSAMGPDPQP